MGLKGLTVNTAPEAEPHIYAEDDAAIYQAICGSDGVFDIGQKCESQVISNNKVRVKDGVIIVGGHFARIPYGDYIDFEIANGQAGKKRNDILIAKFTTTGSGGIDTFTGEVKQGAAVTGTATDPVLTQNDLYQGGKIITIQIDSGAVISAGITKTPIENGYKCSYTATVQDGQHTVKVNAADNDGNEAIEKTASFTVDTVAPELNVTYPPETLITNKQAITVTGKTDTDCTVKIKVNSQDQGTISINGTGEFSKSVNLQKGSNVIVITSTDKAGKVSTVQREVQYDPDAPVVVSVEFNPNPVGAGEEFTITVEATDD